MPPKQANPDAQRNNDALYVFESLFNVTTPIVINVNEISSQTGVKPNTIIKRFSTLRHRHPGLNVQTTAVATSGGTSAQSVPATPGVRNTRKSTGPKKSANTTEPKGNNHKASKADHSRKSTRKAAEKQDAVHTDDNVDDTNEETSDDEATSPVLDKLKKKRAISTSSVIPQNMPRNKKRKIEYSSEDTSSDDESTLTNPVKNLSSLFEQTKHEERSLSGQLHKGTKLPINKLDLVPPVAVKQHSAMGTISPLSLLNENLTGATGTGGVHSSTCVGDGMHNMSMSLPPDNGHMSTAASPPTVPCGEASNSISLPRFILDTDALPLQQTTRPENKLGNETPAGEPPSTLIHQNTLLRNEADCEGRNRIVGLDIGFDDIFD